MSEDVVAVEIDIEELRDRFGQLRKARKLSQKEAGDLIGRSQAFVSAFEKGTYSKIRADSLNQVWKQVQFWNRDSRKIVDGTFPSHGVITVPAPQREIHGLRTTCPSCSKVIPEDDASACYCSGCGNSLRLECHCGHVTTDLESNFCSRCARLLKPRGSKIQSYFGYETRDEKQRMRSVLNLLLSFEADEDDGSDLAQAEADIGRRKLETLP